MATENETMDEGMDSLYADKPMEPEGSVDQQESEADENAFTTVVPTKVLQAGPSDEVKEGDERVLRVVKVYGDQTEVKYAPKEKEEEPSEKSPDEEIDGMSKPGMDY